MLKLFFVFPVIPVWPFMKLLHAKSKFYSVDCSPGSPAKVAEGFRIKARQVTTPDELEAGLDEAFACDGPFFLDIITEPEIDQVPPVYKWLKIVEENKKG
jgi:acetolactate synthase-1/2/3 large subunit